MEVDDFVVDECDARLIVAVVGSSPPLMGVIIGAWPLVLERRAKGLEGSVGGRERVVATEPERSARDFSSIIEPCGLGNGG